MRLALMVLVLALTIYSLLDCARTPEESMPARLPKATWVLLLVFAPGIASIAWIIVSRVKAAEERGGYVEPTLWSSKEGTELRRPPRPRPAAPDDDPEFLRRLEDDIRRRRDHEPRGDADQASTDAGREGAGPGADRDSDPGSEAEPDSGTDPHAPRA